MQIILIISLIGVSAYGQKELCNSSLSVDITNGEKIDGKILKNRVSYNASNYFEMNGMIYGCPCNFKTCITKCCEMGEVMINRTCTKSNLKMKIPIHRKYDFLHHIHVENDTFNKEDYFFIQNRCKSSVQLDPNIYPETDKFFVQENGSLYTPDFEMGTPKFSERYCVDIFQDESIDGKLLALLCVPDDMNKDIYEQLEDGIHITGQ
ncbi:hypothetical protein WA026_012942 [Henosepilachna vigintioctopunctata]|uniref:Methuselah N-terminal domain-containing protein n=1 Tax=Henosepilachna vigintioctopunctata TaxID=420089 RepID=A0AAW1TV03_9CUCU